MNETLIKRKSELMEQIRNEFKILQALQPDFDNAFSMMNPCFLICTSWLISING